MKTFAPELSKLHRQTLELLKVPATARKSCPGGKHAGSSRSAFTHGDWRISTLPPVVGAAAPPGDRVALRVRHRTVI